MATVTLNMTFKGKDNFIVRLLTFDGEVIDYLANEIGPFKGSMATSSEEGKLYLVDVDCSGKWSIQ